MPFSTTQARAAGQEDLRRIGGPRTQVPSPYLLSPTCFLLICHPLRDEDAAPEALEESGLGRYAWYDELRDPMAAPSPCSGFRTML